ncbi:MAG: class I tRNA ligase family protein, partial [Pseudomonadales bacterium]|nr:class I tRNA ligase family protein [Pseudomonadales bacterium]
TPTDSLARRSTQTAMYHVVEMLSRLIAPILSFTADEIWQNIPGERAESVFLTDFTDSLELLPESSEFSDEFWAQVMAVKTAVNKELEVMRADKSIGSGLSAEVDLYCAESLKTLLDRLGEELRFVLIVSRASVADLGSAPDTVTTTEVDGLSLQVTASAHAKCERCWHHRADVGSNTAHPTLCTRCVTNIETKGEIRLYA